MIGQVNGVNFPLKELVGIGIGFLGKDAFVDGYQIFDVIFVSDGNEIGSHKVVFLFNAEFIVVGNGDGLYLLGFGGPAGQPYGVYGGDHQSQRHCTGKDTAPKGATLVKDLDGAPQEHLPCIAADDHADHHGNNAAAEQTEEGLEQRTDGQGEDHQEYRLSFGEGQEIAGAFQLALAVQYQSQSKEQDG